MSQDQHRGGMSAWENALPWAFCIAVGLGAILGIWLIVAVHSTYGSEQTFALVALVGLTTLIAASSLALVVLLLARHFPRSMTSWRLCCGAVFFGFVLGSTYNVIADVSGERFFPNLDHIMPGFTSVMHFVLLICVLGLGVWFLAAAWRERRNGNNSRAAKWY